MIVQTVLILAALGAIGVVSGFLFYVSALSLLTLIVIAIGLLAALLLGYWAGSNSIDPVPAAERLQKLSVINASKACERSEMSQVTPIS